MNRHIVPVLVAVTALDAASCEGTDGSHSGSETTTAGVSTTVPPGDIAVASTDAPAPPTTTP